MNNDIINQLDMLVIVPVLTAVAALVVAWLRAKTREINRKAKEVEVKHNLEMLDEVVLEVAQTLSQTVVGELEKARSDGRLSFEDMERVKLEALQLTYSILDESIVLMLKKGTKDLDCLICSKIEATLCKLKDCVDKKGD